MKHLINQYGTLTLPAVIQTILLALAVIGVSVFFIILFYVLLCNPRMFAKRHGRNHIKVAICYLLLLITGYMDALLVLFSPNGRLIYDTLFGVSGILLTLSAAYDFQHKNVVNKASGTLDAHATVTYNEMIEHSFYQLLNLGQIVYIHSMSWTIYLPVSIIESFLPWMIYISSIMEQLRKLLIVFSLLPPAGVSLSAVDFMTPLVNKLEHWTDVVASLSSTADANATCSYVAVIVKESLLLRLALCMVTVTPWLIRSWFPINRFSDNYNKFDDKSSTLIRILYRIKKYQYVFYKHFLLFGLNLSIALYALELNSNSTTCVSSTPTAVSNTNTGSCMNLRFSNLFTADMNMNIVFRLYWLILNTSYVMEFFLQTLVKKNYLYQNTMLFMQKLLMFSASIVAVKVLSNVHFGIAMTSLILNFTNRGYDFCNNILLMIVVIFLI